MRKLLLSVFAVLLSSSAWAYDAYIDGIYYNLNSKTKEATVTYKKTSYNSYSDDVIIPSSVTYSGVNYSVTSIGDEAFRECKTLKLVKIPNSVKNIGRHAFSYCSGLTSIEIPNGVTSIGVIAFSRCTGLTSIMIPNSVTSIGSEAFSYCSGLTSIVIPNSVTSIGGDAFRGCTGLTSVEIPNSVTSIGTGAFRECTGLTSISVSLTNPFYDSRNSCNAIIETASNTLIAGCKNTIIPNGIITIGSYAFSHFSDLISIMIPNSVTSIGNSAFGGCTGLTSVEIPNSVTSIGDGAFWGCTGLTSVEIPNSVTSIAMSAFASCTGLVSVMIGNGVTNISSYVFQGCSSLTSVGIGNSVKYIVDGAFRDCINLEALYITDIASWCNIKFNSQDSHPFYFTQKSVNFYINNDKATNIDISEGVTSISQYAFYRCNGIISVTIPNSVTSIGKYAFYGCTGLTSIKVKWNRPLAINEYVFYNVDKTSCTLYVPKGTAMMYMSATGWNEFANIIEYEDEADAHYITIRMGDGGVLKQSVEVGKTYLYKVESDEGWTVNTLTFNGEDMTGQLLDGQFSTPVITGDAELNVVFKQEASNIKSMKQAETSKVKVYASNGTIRVAGVEDYTEVVVYNAGGILVGNGEGNCTISLDSGIYIVKVGNETFKVSL